MAEPVLLAVRMEIAAFGTSLVDVKKRKTRLADQHSLAGLPPVAPGLARCSWRHLPERG